MINDGLNLFHKSQRVRQLGVAIECGFVLPARVDVEESRLADCRETVDVETSRFLPGWAKYFLNSCSNCVLRSALGVEVGENEYF